MQHTAHRPYRSSVLLLLCLAISQLPAGCGNTIPIGGADGSLQADASRTPQSIESLNGRPAEVLLDASASQPGDGAIVSFLWFAEQVEIATGEQASVMLTAGDHEITLVVTDGVGRSDSERIVVSVVSPPGDEYSLSIEIIGNGFTAPTPGLSVWPAGTRVALQAIPSGGSQFVRWSGDLASELSSTSIVLNSDVQITAEFSPIEGEEPLPTFMLPFPPGQSRVVSQGNLGESTHQWLYAWDFPMPVGTPIVAAGAGRVLDVDDSSLRNQPDAQIIGQPANIVTIDHGSGLVSVYAHLDSRGARVEPGQLVARGQVIGLSGNTGVSTGPHLHYEIIDVSNASVPSTFWDFRANGGVPQVGDTATSQNSLSLESLQGYLPSVLPHDVFLVNDIELTGETPPAFFYEVGTVYEISGRVRNGKQWAGVALVDPDSLETVFSELTEVEEDGTFTVRFEFPESMVGPHYYGLISGTDVVEGITPLSVLIQQPEDDTPAPVAIVDEPSRSSIDFEETGSLHGDRSVSYRGGGLSYQWVQSSGPPALIADPSAADTEFTVEFGPGLERVAFQLTVFDGRKYSLPAEVEFFMEDIFYVDRINVADVICETPGTCPDLDPPLVSFSTGVLTGWAEVVNAEPGDVLTFRVVTPVAMPVLQSDIIVPPDVTTESFWRFGWSTMGLTLEPGFWAGILERNGETEATVAFRVMP